MAGKFMFTIMLVNIIAIGVSERICPDILLQYNETCFSKCPDGTNYVEETSLCVDTCPDSSPILFKEECFTECPRNKRREENSCFDLNKKSENTNPDTHTIFCPKNLCKQTSKYCFRLQCFDKCPENTVIYDWVCVPKCLKDKPFSFNKTCVRRCPETHPFDENNSCVNSCSAGRYLLNNTCLEHCGIEYFHFNRTCNEQCPSSHPFTFSSNGRMKCFSRCPAYTVNNDTRCVLYCPKETPMLLDNNCLSSCPKTHSLMMIRKSKYNEIGVCVAMCPADLLREDNTCVSTCNTDRKLYNGFCLRKCPSSHEYEISIDSFTPNRALTAKRIHARVLCLANCPTSYKAYNKSCFPVCPFPNLFTFQNTCVDHCPQSHPLQYGKTCVSKCPRKRDGNLCVNQCSFPKLDQDSTCVRHCSGNFPYRLDKKLHIYSNNRPLISVPPRCVDICPWYLKAKFNNTCVSDCPPSANLLDQDDICLSQCPDTRPYIRSTKETLWPFHTKRVCTNICLKGEVVDNGICRQHCTTVGLRYIFNGTCVSNCPESHKLLHTENKIFCQPICNGSNNDIVVFHDACHRDCPSSHPFRLQQTTSVVCRINCPVGYVADNSTCITHKQCSDSGRKFFQNNCTKTCPNNTFLTTINSNENGLWNERSSLQVCNYTCPENHYKYGNTCSLCNSNSYYLYDGSCLNKCPDETIVFKSQIYGNTPNVCVQSGSIWRVLVFAAMWVFLLVLVIHRLYCRRRRITFSARLKKTLDTKRQSLEDNDETCLLEVNDTITDPNIPELSQDNYISVAVTEGIPADSSVGHGANQVNSFEIFQTDQQGIVLHEMPKENEYSLLQTYDNVSTENNAHGGTKKRHFVQEQQCESTEDHTKQHVENIDCSEEETNQKLLDSFTVNCLYQCESTEDHTRQHVENIDCNDEETNQKLLDSFTVNCLYQCESESTEDHTRQLVENIDCNEEETNQKLLDSFTVDCLYH